MMDKKMCAVVKPLEWAQIETAPRGGEWFIARTKRGTARVVHYADEYDRFPISHDGAIWETPPVEWIPLSRLLSAIALRPEADAKAEALAQFNDVRTWFHYPIVMPLKNGKGPVSDAECDTITWEVWDQLLNTHASFDNLPDAINEAMRLNNAMQDDAK